MCSYCGCRNIPMIAKLNAEHDAIVNSSCALEIAFRDQNPEAARLACKELGDLLHPHTHREQVGLFAEMEKTNCSPNTSRRSASNTTNWTPTSTPSPRATCPGSRR